MNTVTNVSTKSKCVTEETSIERKEGDTMRTKRETMRGDER
jgi:hypothetical protein